jgi:sigma-B regulation protein RsbU (phosphoserine phosphatase)
MSTAIPVPRRPRRSLRSLEAAFFGRLRREPPQTKLGRLAFWLLVIGAAASAGHLLPGTAGDLFFVLDVLALTALSFVLFALLWRWVVGRFLWKVRNRLIVTYLLMGLAPIVLFATLAFLAAYVLAGQFAIYISLEQVTRGEAQMGSHNRAMTGHMAHVTSFPLGPTDPSDRPAQGTEEGDGPTTVRVFRDGRLVQRLEPPGKKLPNDPALDHIPAWVSVPFRGLVLDGGRLYLRAIDSEEVGGHTTAVVSSAPVERRGVDQVAQGLGQITIVPDVSGNVGADLHEDDTDADADSGKATEAASKGKVLPAPVVTPSERRERAEALTTRSISGGKLPPAAAFYDLPVSFYAPLPTVDWETGKSRDGITHVTSRPSLLYQHLFSRSLQIAAIVQDALIAVAVFFALLELLAFLLAVRLNQTITRSVHDLYHATLEIDRGHFAHRIGVTRKDQLAALSSSFNTMAGSLERLLEEQREKERLQGELAIAQEVQANLFPSMRISLPMLEVHGVCHPARSVSGDYYDFLLSGASDLSIALGDISGKGISAALLMATLHSAVRAYRFAGEDMTAASSLDPSHGLLSEGGVVATVASAPGISFAEPARIMGLLNRHLFRSTQPEKYATLFLAHYDGVRRTLTYSTGGQLPPLLLRADNTVARLDCGGTVVGLIDRMRYEQGEETMQPGDILIAYSDGVTEPENDFGDFGEDRLLEIVSRHRHLPLDGICEQVMQALRSWIGTAEQPDDITLVLARQR